MLKPLSEKYKNLLPAEYFLIMAFHIDINNYPGLPDNFAKFKIENPIRFFIENYPLKFELPDHAKLTLSISPQQIVKAFFGFAGPAMNLVEIAQKYRIEPALTNHIICQTLDFFKKQYWRSYKEILKMLVPENYWAVYIQKLKQKFISARI